MGELQNMADKVLYANGYTDIFPDAAGITGVYRRLAKTLHPDRYHDHHDRELAHRAFQQLNELKAEAEQMIEEGRFGEPVVIATIRTRHGMHFVRHNLGRDEMATFYAARTKTNDGVVPSVLKVATNARDNDLMANEAKALKALHAQDDKWTRAYPELLDTFVYADGRRRANVTPELKGFLTLRELSYAFPQGIDVRHIVWIWRRILMALGYAHDRGIVYGAVLDSHLMIGPADHAVMLTNWCYSSIATNGAYPPIKAMVKDREHNYPDEVINKLSPSPATDLYMAAMTMLDLDVLHIPRPMSVFFRGCRLNGLSMRPQNAWELLAEFDDLLRDMGKPFHPRRFVELAVPSGTA